MIFENCLHICTKHVCKFNHHHNCSFCRTLPPVSVSKILSVRALLQMLAEDGDCQIQAFEFIARSFTAYRKITYFSSNLGYLSFNSARRGTSSFLSSTERFGSSTVIGCFLIEYVMRMATHLPDPSFGFHLPSHQGDLHHVDSR